MVLPSTKKVQFPLCGSSLVPSCRRAGRVEAQDRTRSGRCGDGPRSIRVTSMSKPGPEATSGRRLVPLGKSAGRALRADDSENRDRDHQGDASAAIPPTVSARNGSSIIGANAEKQQSFPGNQVRRALRAEHSTTGRSRWRSPDTEWLPRGGRYRPGVRRAPG
jgi:hypothetical protein